MKTKNSAKGDNQRQGTPQDENYSQEELLNMDELFDLQGGIDDKQLESCGLGCFSGATRPCGHAQFFHARTKPE